MSNNDRFVSFQVQIGVYKLVIIDQKEKRKVPCI